MTEQLPPEEESRRPAVYSPPPGVIPGSPRPAPPPPPPAPVAQPRATSESGIVTVASTSPTPPARPTGMLALLPTGMSLNTLAIYVVLALMAIVAAALGWEQLSAAASSDAARRSADADKAMAQVVSDQARIGDKISGAYTPLKGADPATKVTTADSIRKSIDAVQPDLDQSSKLIGGDQGAVRTAMTEANDRGVLGLLEGDKLDHKAAQLTSVMNALDIRADEISTAKGQLQLLEHLTTAEEHFGELGHALQNKDLASAQAIYNPANDAIKQAVTDAQAPNTPDAARTTVDQLNNLFEDTKAVMNSLQNGDLGGYDASLRAFLIHYENLLGIDPNGVRNGYDQLVKNYDQRYFSEMKDAGLPSSGGKSL